MKRVLVIHGPNLNLLGRREPDIYGSESLDSLNRRLSQEAEALGLELELFQSNHEGALIDRLQEAAGGSDGVILNPGGLAHSSVSLRDAVAAAGVPVIEVHLSNTVARESFRRRDLIAPVCTGLVMGLGPGSYLAALGAMQRLLEDGEPGASGSGRRSPGEGPAGETRDACR
jgi:3-dehydroquinate dehydratase-2